MEHDVFISYSNEDKITADEICRLLEQQGIRCWIAPRDILPGRDYGVQIIEGIELTRVMVLLLSEHANTSIYVKAEIERAISKGKVVIPLRIQDVQPSRALELFVSRSQWIDAWTPPLAARVQILAAAIHGLLGLPAFEEDLGNRAAPGQSVRGVAPAGRARSARLWLFAAVPALLLVVALVVALAVSWLGSRGGAATPLPTALQVASTQGAVPALPPATMPPAAGPAATDAPTRPTSTPPPTAVPLPPPTPKPPRFTWPQAEIAVGNAAQVTQLVVWDQERAFQVFWSPDGATLVVNTESKIYFLDARTLETLYKIEPSSSSSSRGVAISRDWTMIARAAYEGVQVWDMQGAELGVTFAGSKESVGAAFSADGKLLATKTGGTIKLWDPATGTELRTLSDIGGGTVGSVAFSPDGTILAGGGEKLRLWSTADWSEIRTLSTDRLSTVQALAFSPDGQTLAAAALNGQIRLWEVASGRQLRNFEHGGWLHDLAFSPDGSVLATASWESTVKLWDIAANRELATLVGHTDRAEAVSFSPDGMVLATGGLDKSLRLWGVR